MRFFFVFGYVIISSLKLIREIKMRPINVKDSDGKMIFEGDKVEILGSENIKFEICHFFDVDRCVFEILENGNEVGVSLKASFYFKGEQIKTEDVLKVFKEMQEGKEGKEEIESLSSEERLKMEKEQEKFFSDLKESEEDGFLTLKINSAYSNGGYINAFYYIEKRIIESKLTLEEKEAHSNYNEALLRVTVNGESYPAQTTIFVVELSEVAKTRLIEAHDSLHGQFNHGFAGDFSHIILRPNRVEVAEYEMKASPVNKDGIHTWFSIEENKELREEFQFAANDLIREKFNSLEKTFKENQEESKKAFETKMLKAKKTIMSSFEKDKNNLVEEQIVDMFIGFEVGKNVLDYLVKTGCKITRQ